MWEPCDSVEVTDEDRHCHNKSMHRNSDNPEVWPMPRIHRSGEPDKTPIHQISAPSAAYMLGSLYPSGDHQAAQPSASASGVPAVPPAIARSNNNSVIIHLNRDSDPDGNRIDKPVNHQHPHRPLILVNQVEVLQDPI